MDESDWKSVNSFHSVISQIFPIMSKESHTNCENLIKNVWKCSHEHKKKKALFQAKGKPPPRVYKSPITEVIDLLPRGEKCATCSCIVLKKILQSNTEKNKNVFDGPISSVV